MHTSLNMGVLIGGCFALYYIVNEYKYSKISMLLKICFSTVFTCVGALYGVIFGILFHQIFGDYLPILVGFVIPTAIIATYFADKTTKDNDYCNLFCG